MNVALPELHLASASPRRRDILTSLGIRFSYAGTDIDESPRTSESPHNLVSRLALAKAAAGLGHHGTESPVLAADTIVVAAGRILGKPGSRDEAVDMLRRLSGQEHRVLTAVCVVKGETSQSAVSETIVRFREIDHDEALAYWHSGEPVGKAGAYAIQGMGGIFVRSISGSYSGVVGLPVFETAGLLRNAGIEIIVDRTRV